LQDGRTLATLHDAFAFLDRLPERKQAEPHWQYTAQLLLPAAESGSAADLAAARDQLCRALAWEGFILN
jgi:hypothetical protein